MYPAEAEQAEEAGRRMERILSLDDGINAKLKQIEEMQIKITAMQNERELQQAADQFQGPAGKNQDNTFALPPLPPWYSEAQEQGELPYSEALPCIPVQFCLLASPPPPSSSWNSSSGSLSALTRRSAGACATYRSLSTARTRERARFQWPKDYTLKEYTSIGQAQAPS